MADSIFTKIIKGEIPCHKIYEDDQVIAILDIHPITPGHTLVIPKKQIKQFTKLEPEDYSYLMAVSQLVAQKVQSVTGCLRVFYGLKVLMLRILMYI
jgi:histidine triad (HIT) family protein